MAEWMIEADEQRQKVWRAVHGDAEFERRTAIANAKADELAAEPADPPPNEAGDGEEGYDSGHDGTNWAEAMVLRPAFHVLAMQLRPEQMDVAWTKPGRWWANLVYLYAERGGR